MLFLLKEQHGSNVYYLSGGKEYSVGRKNADIIINNDPSISRKHAIIKIGPSSATIIDCKSKYSTFQNNKKIAPETETCLEDNDTVKFGVYQSIYSLEKMRIVTTASALNNVQKNELRKKLESVSGTFVNNWDQTCSHLTTQEIVLTVKVLHAIIDNKPIVKIEFWDKFVEKVRNNQAPPNPHDFKPPLAESVIDLAHLTFNPMRKNIFSAKTLVFPNEKIKSKMSELIAKTGGKCIAWDNQPLSVSQIISSIDNYLFIHSDEIRETDQSLLEIYDNLTKLGKRTIPIQEIAMAILKCSCEKDCNPNFNRVEKVFLKPESDASSQIFQMVTETQSQELDIEPKVEQIIPGSLESNFELDLPVKTAAKRPLEDNRENLFKKMKVESLTPNDSRKRKPEENIGTASKKSSIRENPFALLLKNKNPTRKVGTDNPFAAMRIKKETSVLVDNPFINRVAEQSGDDLFVEETPRKPSLSDTSYVSPIRSTPLSSLKWLSKSNYETEPVETVIKEEFKDIYNLFKDKLVIEVLPIVARRIDISDSVDGSLMNKSSSGKNFKKFKKVQPVRPQRNIINATVPQFANTKTNIEENMLSDGEEDVRPVAKKPRRRFDF